ncbi:hypothetical protein JQ557_11315 [Bradyrhizobium sp. U87765 SZCCT0131]|uniref:hypothetical protein n=1 Tax=unclassified Bradyrhizobium TaxID=2631580 RepID=UPI001BABDA5B|nr:MULTISPECIES: hypothetical protein [unclassified Bradyrhizobium]MBR1218581.1 hypothetical protein [Bradyrhizobium sp. U87765 SZCCT0131]MBR1265660.1 hypothetical protein [Bradyrhizobium sp. U87765 SZCCT0134]MBR1304079.1 hypothetical protein [Bradyrhizobium sp. U87765 SZCCT0110]MBR1319685.1 hypothetical protein [Bradyrhizobium sp. U87765 SZCCT0109]MBR1348010.1 hypothetical protein [Bradyrhizobium sp. U87765 SZCCT0048]
MDEDRARSAASALLLTSAAKLPLPDDGADELERGRAGGGAVVADGSDVTLNTGTLLH